MTISFYIIIFLFLSIFLILSLLYFLYISKKTLLKGEISWSAKTIPIKRRSTKQSSDSESLMQYIEKTSMDFVDLQEKEKNIENEELRKD